MIVPADGRGEEARPTRCQIIATVYDEWEQELVEGRVKLDLKYAEKDNPEGVYILCAPLEAQDDLHRRQQAALREAGYGD